MSVDPRDARWRIVWERVIVQQYVYEDVLTQDEALKAQPPEEHEDDLWKPTDQPPTVRLKSMERVSDAR
jgi:hypothetical protein